MPVTASICAHSLTLNTQTDTYTTHMLHTKQYPSHITHHTSRITPNAVDAANHIINIYLLSLLLLSNSEVRNHYAELHLILLWYEDINLTHSSLQPNTHPAAQPLPPPTYIVGHINVPLSSLHDEVCRGLHCNICVFLLVAAVVVVGFVVVYFVNVTVDIAANVHCMSFFLRFPLYFFRFSFCNLSDIIVTVTDIVCIILLL